MVLSNVELHAALDQRRLMIDPEPTPRTPTVENPQCPYDTSAVDLRLGGQISVPLPEKPFVFDLRRGGLAKFLTENCRAVTIDPDGGFALQPNQFVLGNTVERITLPIVEERLCLAARVEGKSSFTSQLRQSMQASRAPSRWK